MNCPHGAPYTLLSLVTVIAKFLSRLPTHDASPAATRFFCGASAWNSDPVLYSKTSFIELVDSRVLTTLSPSVPCGRLSTLTVMSGFFAEKSLASCSAVLTVSCWLSTRNDRVTLPPLSSLLPRLPALHAPSASVVAARTATD